MHLSGQVPGRIRRWLPEHGPKLLPPEPPALWAVHAGGRSILDAVQQGLAPRPRRVALSPATILRDYGNMSSATLMFVLERILLDPDAPRARHGDGLRSRPVGRNLRLHPAMNLARRSTQQERMDTDCVDFADYSRCLRDLSRVNIVTLTHRPMLAWLARHATADFSLLDVACGHGDALRQHPRALSPAPA